MVNLVGGSAILRWCRSLSGKIKATARESIFFGGQTRRDAVEHSGIAAAMNRVHPIEAALGAAARSGILRWLYEYWGNLCAMPVRQLVFAAVPLLGLLTLRMLLAGRLMVAAVTAVCLAASLLLRLAKGTVGSWIRGSLLGRFLPLPNGTEKRSTAVWLGLCGLLGGGVGWIAGVTYGVAATVAATVLPAVFCLPAYWAVCLLLAGLPLCSTGICWALSAAVVVFYFLERAFGGLSGKKIDGWDVFLMVFPVFCVISAVFSFDRADSLKVIAMWLGLFLCVPFVRRILTTRQKLMGGLWALMVGAAVSGGYGLYQYLSGMTNDTWTDTALFDNIQLRVYSTFANPNVYGEFLLLIIPLAAAMALYFKGWKRWLLVAMDVLLAANLLLTYSRGCYVGIALTAVVFLWNYSKKWLAAIAAVGIPLAIAVMPASVMSRIMSIGNMSDSSTSYRMMIYIGTFLMFSRYWFSGVGIGEGAFNAIYPIYALTGIIAPHSHSLFFQSVVSFGILGLVYLLALWVIYQRRVQRVQRHLPRQDRLLMIGFGSVMWGMLVQSIFDYTWYNYRVFQLFWLVIALGIAAAEVLQERRNENG